MSSGVLTLWEGVRSSATNVADVWIVVVVAESRGLVCGLVVCGRIVPTWVGVSGPGG